MCVIILNIIIMALDSPLLHHDDTLKVMIHYSEMVFTLLYGLEILIKFIACGLFSKGGYFRDPKNLIDFGLFTLNIIGFVVTSNLGYLNALRAFHIVLLSKHFDSLRIILVSLYKSLPHLMKLLFFSFCFMLVSCKELTYFYIKSFLWFILSYLLAVLPLRMLKGKMYSCISISNQHVLEKIQTKLDCFDLGGDWIR